MGFLSPKMPAIQKSEAAPVSVAENKDKAENELERRRKQKFGLNKTVLPGTLGSAGSTNNQSGNTPLKGTLA